MCDPCAMTVLWAKRRASQFQVEEWSAGFSRLTSSIRRRFSLYQVSLLTASSHRQKGWLGANYGISVFLPIMRPEAQGGGETRRADGWLPASQRRVPRSAT